MFPIALAKAIAIAPCVSQSPTRYRVTADRTCADLPIPGSPSTSAPGSSTEPVETPRRQRPGSGPPAPTRSHRMPEVNLAIRPSNQTATAISYSVDRRMFPAVASSSIIARATCRREQSRRTRFVYLLPTAEEFRVFEVNRGSAFACLPRVVCRRCVPMSVGCRVCRRYGRGGVGLLGCGSRRHGGPPVLRGG